VPNETERLPFAIAAKDSQQLMFRGRESLCEEYPVLATEKAKPTISLFMMADGFAGFPKGIQS
jgi:hypothetical protein